MEKKDARIDIDAPLWDQSTFVGRFKHFAFMTDPRTVLTSEDDLHKAKKLVEQYRLGKEPSDVTRDQIIYAKKLYSSAFHPDSGELQNVFGRMSFQVPGGMIITGAMLQFYRTVPAVVFWQFVNQSFNALVNYTNRNANSPVSVTQLGVSYVSATTSALVAAIGCKSFWQKRAGALMLRYVPFAAVAAANCVNIPLMRQNELTQGVDVVDDDNNVVGKSRVAAVKGISQVVFSRVLMAAPGMLLLPILMEKLERINWFRRLQILHAPFQVLAVGGFLIFMVPTACSIFPQRCSINMSTIQRFDSELYGEMQKKHGKNLPEKVYFNKGL
ncbi:sideroflexin-2 isoform X1 [Bradysia coprophila]|uniref:sideroflexin-2 isoform X1 n=2 Tax=Bradysia coprophila TaxID=38358 RepID=UPI00187D7C77|nr:sideroflexin-2 isoform X1 [Bradysia coprophila]XP_037032018.1 sideroflexin-2 isoform X1 [Bradysia coprophila]